MLVFCNNQTKYFQSNRSKLNFNVYAYLVFQQFFISCRPTSSIGKDDKTISPSKLSAQHQQQHRPSRPRTAPPPVRGSSAKSSRSESAHHPVSETGVSGARPPSVGPRGSRDHVDGSRATASSNNHLLI